MANQGPSYGLSRACQVKIREKFNLQQAKEALSWIEEVIGRRLQPSSAEIQDHRDAASALRDGVALCELMNKILPGCVPKINKQPTAFKQMENIELFIKACHKYGMDAIDTFQTQDLYEAKCMYTVINSVFALGSLAKKNGFEGPTIGVKYASRNERHFSAEQLAESGRVIGQQYGSNAVPSQSGMTPYGLQRQIFLKLE